MPPVMPPTPQDLKAGVSPQRSWHSSLLTTLLACVRALQSARYSVRLSYYRDCQKLYVHPVGFAVCRIGVPVYGSVPGYEGSRSMAIWAT